MAIAGTFLRRFLGSAISNAAGYGVGGAILPTLEPLTQDLANETWSLHTVKPLPVGLAAEAAVRGYWPDARGGQEAAYTGFDSERYDIHRELAGTAPPLETLLQLRRREAITDAELSRGVRQLGVREEWRPTVGALLNVLPSVTDMIRFAVREVFNPAQRSALDLDAEYPDALTDAGSRIGLSRTTLGQYWAAHWELPSYTQGAQMMYRGEITETQFEGLLKALDYAPVWRGPLAEIARAIPSVTDMIRFAVREVYNPTQRSALDLDAEYPDALTGQAAKHGLASDDARDYWAAHWRLPSATQGFRMLHRGEITQEQLDGLLKALDYAPVWRDRLSNIARLVPGRIDLKRLLKYEIIDRAEVEAGYRRLGYSPLDAERMTEIAVSELEVSDTGQPWATKARSSLFTVAHREYVDGSLDDAQASALLTSVGASASERPRILELWGAERAATRRELTPAEIRKALNTGLYDRERALAALDVAGMTPEDAATFLDEDTG